MLLSLFRWVAAILATLFFGGMALLCSPFDFKGGIHDFWARSWGKIFLFVFGARVTVEGERYLAAKLPLIVMSNHRSHLDIAVILSVLPFGVRSLVKKELRWIPIFGWALSATGHIYVDRKDREKAFQSIRQAAQRVREGKNVLVFTEGTRGDGTDLLPFKKGGFILAIESQVPILPIAVVGTERILPKKGFRVMPGKVRMVVGGPILTQGYTYESRDALIGEVRRAIEKQIELETHP
jgi:1-acyl-sn-glycerol-3-phosphate acyltransferase